MADIELVIKIPKWMYKASQIINVKYEDVIQIPLEVIANSTPLEDIKTEIEKMDFDFGDYYDHTDSIINMVLETIDNHIKEDKIERNNE